MFKLGMVAHNFDSSTKEAETGGCLIPGHPGMQYKILRQKKEAKEDTKQMLDIQRQQNRQRGRTLATKAEDLQKKRTGSLKLFSYPHANCDECTSPTCTQRKCEPRL